EPGRRRQPGDGGDAAGPQDRRAADDRRARRRPAGLGLPGGDADPGADPLLHPEDRRDGRRDRRRRALDARPDDGLHGGALGLHPVHGRRGL
ncbi:MAG: Flagellar biosynthesis protein FliQ, partial [uncultured Solirubrobacteraceae bacterium]